ncbi:MAG: hypothetical protein KDB22_12820 [Planctomycetales bacterium]|nr:hypothetical protein [Planctomycetales bacterium]
MSDFLIWSNNPQGYDCSLTDFQGMEKTFPLLAGAPLAEEFPSDASFRMEPEDPQNTRLTDSLANTNAVVVGSQKLVDFFSEHKVPEVEFLPVTVFDHKGKPVATPYSIIHPIHPIDCLDLENSQPRYSKILPDQINKVESLVLLEDKIPEDRVFFRCLNFYRVIIARRSFAEQIKAAGMTGVDWTELTDYP